MKGKGKTVKAKKPAALAEPTNPPKARIDLKLVPKPVDLNRMFIAPPSLPMRHHHVHAPVSEVMHPEVRLVIKTRYMEQKPHVLIVESAMFATVAAVFFGIILFMLRISPALVLPFLLPLWLAIVIFSYKLFEG